MSAVVHQSRREGNSAAGEPMAQWRGMGQMRLISTARETYVVGRLGDVSKGRDRHDGQRMALCGDGRRWLGRVVVGAGAGAAVVVG